MTKKLKNLTSTWTEIVEDSKFVIPLKELSRALKMYNITPKLSCPHDDPHVPYAKWATAESPFVTLLDEATRIDTFYCANDNQDNMCCLMYHSQQGSENIAAFTIVISTEQRTETGMGKSRKSVTCIAPVLVMNGFLSDIHGESFFLAKEAWCLDDEESKIEGDDLEGKFIAFDHEDFRRILCVAAEAADSITNNQPVDPDDILPWLYVPEEDIERKFLEATADPNACFTDVQALQKSLINGTHSLKAPSALQ